MSFPYPRDRNRDRREKGEQPYRDARETFTQQEAQEQAEAESELDFQRELSEEEHREEMEREAEERFKQVAEEDDES